MYWGNSTCGDTVSSLLYSGVVTSDPDGNPFCLPLFCTNSNQRLCASFDLPPDLGFVPDDWATDRLRQVSYIRDGQPFRLECSLCFESLASTVIALPAARQCPPNWCLKYRGVMARVSEASGELVCVNPITTTQPPDGSGAPAELAALETTCFGPECNTVGLGGGLLLRVPCVVCSHSNTNPCP